MHVIFKRSTSVSTPNLSSSGHIDVCLLFNYKLLMKSRETLKG